MAADEPINRGLVLSGDWAMALEERPLEPPQPHEAVIEIDVAGICGSDLHMAAFSAEQTLRHRVAGVFAGHEGAGRVLRAPAESGLREGERVLIYHYESCWSCAACERGYLQWCPRRQALSMDRDGALARYVTVDARNCLPLPDDFTTADGACLACTAGTAAAAVRKLGDALPRPALVVGLGPLGAAAAQLLTGLGCEVVGIEPHAGRRAFALRRGIVAAAYAEPPGKGRFAAVVDASGTTAARTTAMACAAPGATLVLIGMGEDVSPLPVKQAILDELTLIGSNILPIDAYPELLDLYRAAHVRPSALISEHVALDAIEDAFARARTAPGKIVARPAAQAG